MLFPTLPYILTLWLHPHTHSQSQEQVGGSPLRAASPLPAYARAPRGSRSPRKPAQGTQEPLAPAASAPGAGAPAAPCARAAAPGAEAFSGSLGDAATVWQVPGLTSPPARAEQQEYAADPVWARAGTAHGVQHGCQSGGSAVPAPCGRARAKVPRNQGCSLSERSSLPARLGAGRRGRHLSASQRGSPAVPAAEPTAAARQRRDRPAPRPGPPARRAARPPARQTRRLWRAHC